MVIDNVLEEVEFGIKVNDRRILDNVLHGQFPEPTDFLRELSKTPQMPLSGDF